MIRDRDLIEAAVAARASAYAPYSGFRVGAALLLADGQVVSGVNVENSSYGLTVCAERNAVAAAVRSTMQPGDIRVVAIAADAATPTPPCGACRQVLSEFAGPDTRFLLFNERDGAISEKFMSELLPLAFDSNSFAAQ